MSEGAKDIASSKKVERKSFEQNRDSMYEHLSYRRDYYNMNALHWTLILVLFTLTLVTKLNPFFCTAI
ncbi:MAG: hypothetical protein OHK0056_27950 [Bacteriovoracaceae bacterium]